MIENKKIKNVFEYMILFLVFFLGLKKGGYYKADSVVIVFFMDILLGMYFVIFRKSIKIEKVSLPLFFLAIWYFVAIINSATVSGAFNISTRIYLMYLMYLFVRNSDNREKYLKAVVVITLLFGIFGVDEISNRLFEKPLEAIGGGYLDKENTRVSSVLEYANLFGILCLISNLILYSSVQKNNSKVKYKEVAIFFLNIMTLLTQSKMAIILGIFSQAILVIYYAKNKTSKIDIIINAILSYILSFLTVSIVEYNPILVIISSCLIYFAYVELFSKIKSEKAKRIIASLLLLISIIVIIFNIKYISKQNIILRFKEYFSSFDSTISRFTYYKDSIKILIKTPLNFFFGVGGNGFRTMYETVQQTNYISLETHSIIFQILVETGIVGLLFFMYFILNSLIRSKNNINKFVCIILTIFSFCDVYLTYTFMLLIFGIIYATLDLNTSTIQKNIVKKIVVILNYTIYVFVLILNTSFFIAYATIPTEVEDVNNSVEEQEKIIKKCEKTLKYDPWDYSYIEKLILANKTYLEIIDIKEEMGESFTTQKAKAVNEIFECVNNELKYEKHNKYALYDAINYTYENVDLLVDTNFAGREKEGYKYYLEFMQKNLEKLKNEHSKNDLAIEMYNNLKQKITYKYMTVVDVMAKKSYVYC